MLVAAVAAVPARSKEAQPDQLIREVSREFACCICCVTSLRLCDLLCERADR